MIACFRDIWGMSRELVEKGRNHRRKRILLKEQDACYHLVSRAPFGHFFLVSEATRQMFVKMMLKQAGFCGVEVLAYCVMSNHFHLLVRIPFQRAGALSDDMLLRRYRCLYSGRNVPLSSFSCAEVQAILVEGGEQADALRKALTARMGDLSVFMRELKQRFAVWYNNTFDNKGSVWSGRFQSQVIQNDPRCLQMVAAYIDLNPIRAALVDDPKNYLFSSFGAASSEDAVARDGYRKLYQKKCLNGVLDAYQRFLYAKGANRKDLSSGGVTGNQGVVPSKRVRSALSKNKSESGYALATHCRHFICGGALGDEAFVEAVFLENRNSFSKKRRSGARKIRGESALEAFRVLRNVS